MNMKKAACVLMVGFLAGCATSPMQARLEQNFVYNCSLILLEKKVGPSEVEKLCVSAHRAEMEEKKLQFEITGGKAAVMPEATAAEREPAQSSPVETKVDTKQVDPEKK